MPSARMLLIFLVLATSSTAVAATKAIKFGKLIDGTGRVFTNAVVVVEDERVQSVANGNAPIPGNAEMIDLSPYTGVPGLIDAHTHITYYWDGHTTPRSEPSRHPRGGRARKRILAVPAYGPVLLSMTLVAV